MGSSCKASIPYQLITFLNKILEKKLENVDEVYFDNFITELKKYVEENDRDLDTFLPWFETCKIKWSGIAEDSLVAGFIICFTGILCKKKKIFLQVKNLEILDLIFSPEYAKHKQSNLRRSFLIGLTNLVEHEPGINWLFDKGIWKETIQMAEDDVNIYIQRSASTFILNLLRANEDVKHERDVTKFIAESMAECLKANVENEADLEKKLIPKLKLLIQLLDDGIEGKNQIAYSLIESFQIEALLLKKIEQVSNQKHLCLLIQAYGALIIAAVDDDGDVSALIDLQRLLMRTNRVNAVLHSARVSHISWLKAMKKRPELSDRTETHFYLLQILPLLFNLRKNFKNSKNELMENYSAKLFELSSEETVRMAYMVRDILRFEPSETKIDLAVKATRGIMNHIHLMDHEKIVLTFQSLAWQLKTFVPTVFGRVEEPTEAEWQDARDICASAAPLLAAVLEAFITMLNDYKIAWGEAFEGLCLLTICRLLLENPELPVRTVSLTLKVTQLVISQFLPPALALLVNNLEGTSLEEVGPILVKKLHDVHWEVRDSALEVIAVLAELSLHKFPSFTNLILNQNYCQLVMSILEGDAETYVRASAVKVLIAMVPVDELWEKSLSTLEMPRFVLNLLKTETEGIVRREAALLVTQLYNYGRFESSFLETVFEAMLRATTNELHWEVQVNALAFWEQVINKRLQEQGMMDGFFPAVTFSKEKKKIISLNEPEIQSRLLKVLEELSSYGCLNALLEGLHDECEAAVVQKSSAVLNNLLTLFRTHGIVPATIDRTRKRKLEFDLEKHPPQSIPNGSVNSNRTSTSSSKDVIEDIVQASDMKLLLNVLQTETSDQPIYKKETVDRVSVESFLEHVKDFDLDGFVEDKTKWLVANPVGDLSKLLETVLNISFNCDDNMPDCY